MDRLLNHPYIQLGKFIIIHYAGRRRVVIFLKILLAILGAGISLKILLWLLMKHRLSQRRLQKRRQCREALTDLQKDLAVNSKTTQEECSQIVDLSLPELQAKLKNGHLTPSQVLKAYQYKALEAHASTNCLVEPIKEAKTWALELEAGDNKNLPLYGVPVSIKDNLCVKGYDSFIGCTKWIGRPFAEDAVILKALKKQGAVPFMKTSVSQIMLSFHTSNPVLGATTNPYNKERIAGGSSGGEGALLAEKGSILGFGGDLGGSVRIPAHFCGVYGFKATSGRLSIKGGHPFLKGQTIVPTCYGPMARDVDGLVEAMRALLVPAMFNLDTSVPPLTFNEMCYSDTRKVKIGYYTSNGLLQAVPACERAVREAVNALHNQGHEVVEWDFSKFSRRIVPLWPVAIWGDGGKEVASIIAGDEVDPALWNFHLAATTSPVLRKILSFLLAKVNPELSDVLKSSHGTDSISGWWKLSTEVKAITEEVVQDWQSYGLDVVICPGLVCPATPHYLPGICTSPVGYTSVFNVLGFPAGTVPVSKVTRADTELMDRYPTPDWQHKLLKQAQEGSEGLPVGVQVVALPWQDELCLRVMKELESAFKH